MTQIINKINVKNIKTWNSRCDDILSHKKKVNEKKKQTGTFIGRGKVSLFIYVCMVRFSIDILNFWTVDKKCAKYINCLFLLDKHFKIIKSKRKKEGNEVQNLHNFYSLSCIVAYVFHVHAYGQFGISAFFSFKQFLMSFR